MPQILRVLIVATALAGLPAAARADDKALDKAIERGLERVQTGAASYLKHRACFSCHHQALPIQTLSEAQRLGWKIDDKAIGQQVEFSAKSFQEHAEDLPKGQGIGGGSDTVAYGLAAFDAAKRPADDLTKAMVQYLLAKQRKEGAWPVAAKRPPSEVSPFTTTTLAIRGLQAYGLTLADKELADASRKAIDQAKAWLADAKPEDTEDHVFRILGLAAVKADVEAINAAAKELLKLQRDDGGWGQTKDLASDAYATGSVLVALRRAGMAVDDDAVKRGVAFLIKTQRDDGAWLVETRSRPIQTFFDNGDPGGKSQFISFAATNWALLALLDARGKR